jgi:glycosyltransferase involved in cell wall biosynthesis
VQFLSTRSCSNIDRQGAFVKCSVTNVVRDDLRPHRRIAAAAKAFWNQEAAAAMETILARFRPDLVHAHKLYPQLSVSPLVVARRRDVPVVQTLHDYEFLSASTCDARGGWLDRKETRFSYRLLNSATFPLRRLVHSRCVSEWISVSPFVARLYLRAGIKSTVIPNFVEDGGDHAVPEFSDRAGVVFVGRLVEEKGILDVLQLARQMKEVSVTVVGDGPLRQAAAAAAEAQPNLVLLGAVDGARVRAVLRNARVAVMPSRWHEPGPLVALEAMSVGTPVAAYAQGGMEDYIRMSGGGQVVDPDVKKLVSACRQLYEDETLWGRASARGRAAIETTHSAKVYAQSLEDVYDRARSRY